MTISPVAYQVLGNAQKYAEQMRNAFVTPEHVLYSISHDGEARGMLHSMGFDTSQIQRALVQFLDALDSESPEHVELSSNLKLALEFAMDIASSGASTIVDIPQILQGISCLNNSLAGFLLNRKTLQNK